jgi:UDP-N-acetylmuramate dehydrogenase
MVTKEKKVRTHSECEFTYRESIFKNALKNKVIITAVTFMFEKQSPDYVPNIQYNDIQDTIAEQGIDPNEITALQVANIIIKIREGKLPDRKKIGTAGSFFKNPVIEKDQFEKLLLEYPQLK